MSNIQDIHPARSSEGLRLYNALLSTKTCSSLSNDDKFTLCDAHTNDQILCATVAPKHFLMTLFQGVVCWCCP